MQAMYHTTCPACQDSIYPGNDIELVTVDEQPRDRPLRVTVHADCASDSTGILTVSDGPVRRADVMPRGKSKRDMCLKCFMVPSNNGACGCDS